MLLKLSSMHTLSAVSLSLPLYTSSSDNSQGYSHSNGDAVLNSG